MRGEEMLVTERGGEVGVGTYLLLLYPIKCNLI
jgi:hypothetical protein